MSVSGVRPWEWTISDRDFCGAGQPSEGTPWHETGVPKSSCFLTWGRAVSRPWRAAMPVGGPHREKRPCARPATHPAGHEKGAGARSAGLQTGIAANGRETPGAIAPDCGDPKQRRRSGVSARGCRCAIPFGEGAMGPKDVGSFARCAGDAGLKAPTGRTGRRSLRSSPSPSSGGSHFPRAVAAVGNALVGVARSAPGRCRMLCCCDRVDGGDLDARGGRAFGPARRR